MKGDESQTLALQYAQLQKEFDRATKMNERTVKDLEGRLFQMQDKLDNLDRIQNAIISILLEVRQRSNQTFRLDSDVEAEREELRHSTPLVLLDSLRSQLRILLSLKDQKESLLSRDLESTEAKQTALSREFSATLSAQELEAHATVAKLKTLEGENTLLKARLKATMTEAQQLVETLRLDNERLVKLNEQREDEALELRDRVATLEKALNEKDFRLIKISQLETQLQVDRMQHQFDIAKKQAQHMRTIEQYQKEVKHFASTQADNASLKRDLTLMRSKLSSYDRNILQMRLREAEAEVERLGKRVEELEATSHELETQRKISEKRRKGAEEACAAAQRQLTRAALGRGVTGSGDVSATALDTVTPLSAAHGRREHGFAVEGSTGAGGDTSNGQEGLPFITRSPSPPRVVQPASASRQNPTKVKAFDETEDVAGGRSYRKMLKEKDKEIVELAARVRKLLTLHHRNTLAKKAWADERARLEAELASLRDQLVRARGTAPRTGLGSAGALGIGIATLPQSQQAAALSPSSPIAGLSDPEAVSRELQNLRSLGTTTAAALEKLKSEGGGIGMGTGLGGRLGNTYGFEQHQLKTVELAPIPTGVFTQRQTQSALDRLSGSVTFTEYGSALTGKPRRPVSTRGNRLGHNGMPTLNSNGTGSQPSSRPISASTLRR